MFAQSWPAVQGKSRVTFAGHVVRRGDTLSSISLDTGVSVDRLQQLWLPPLRRQRQGRPPR